LPENVTEYWYLGSPACEEQYSECPGDLSTQSTSVRQLLMSLVCKGSRLQMRPGARMPGGPGGQTIAIVCRTSLHGVRCVWCTARLHGTRGRWAGLVSLPATSAWRRRRPRAARSAMQPKWLRSTKSARRGPHNAGAHGHGMHVDKSGGHN
jgi:hypothetical protein